MSMFCSFWEKKEISQIELIIIKGRLFPGIKEVLYWCWAGSLVGTSPLQDDTRACCTRQCSWATVSVAVTSSAVQSSPCNLLVLRRSGPPGLPELCPNLWRPWPGPWQHLKTPKDANAKADVSSGELSSVVQFPLHSWAVLRPSSPNSLCTISSCSSHAHTLDGCCIQ